MAGLLNRTRLVVAGLAIVALVLGTLIYRDVFVPSKNAASALNLYTVARRTVTASVTGSGIVEPQQQANVNFKAMLVYAVIDQLGLKLESARDPIEMLVVDRVEKPSQD